MEQQRNNTRNEYLQSRVGYVKKNFTINEKKFNSKPVSSVSSLCYSVSQEGIAPDPKHVEKIKNAKPPSNIKQLESFVGLANFYGRVIPDFATKMLPLNEIRKEEFGWEKEQQNAFENIKNELSYVLTLLYSPTA